MIHRGDRYVAILMLLLSIASIVQASRLPFGQAGDMGPGFFPLCSSIILFLMAVVLLMKTSKLSTQQIGVTNDTTQMLNVSQTWLTASGLLIYVLCLKQVGFLASTFIFLVVFDCFIRRNMSRATLMRSLIMLAVIYSLLVVLRIPMPRGLWIR